MEMKLATGKAHKVDKTMNYLFVLSAGGRTGSTSLTRMVNAIPGFYIAGENGGVMRSFNEMTKHIMEHSTHVGEYLVNTNSGNLTHADLAWSHRPIVEAKVFQAIRDYTTAIIGEVNETEIHTIGFKEIRDYGAEELDLFLKVYPGARFIFLTRNLIAQSESIVSNAEWENPGFKDETLRHRKAALSMEQFQAEHPDIALLMRTEDFDLDTFNHMLTWLGVDQCRFINVAQDSTLSLSNDHFITCDQM
jgi:hypothetical protein